MCKKCYTLELLLRKLWRVKMLVSNAVNRLAEALISYSDSHDEMKNAVTKLINEIRYGKVIDAKNNPKSLYVFGKVSTGGLVARMLDPALLKIFPKGSLVNAFLKKGKFELPLHEHLSWWHHYRDLASLLKIIGDKYGIQGSTRDNPAEYKMSCATIGLLLEVVNTLGAFGKPQVNVKWCKFCFRHTSCAEHETTTNFDTYDRDYDNYNLGRKNAKMLNEDVRNRWELQRSERRLQGEDFKLDRTEKDDPYHLAYITQSKPWDFALPMWEKLLTERYPIVSEMLDLKVESKENWKVFAEDIKAKLSNRDETTKHPLWIMYMLDQAEDWFFVEKNQGKSTLDKILEIYPSKTTNKSEVARLLNISRMTVDRALAKHHDLN